MNPLRRALLLAAALPAAAHAASVEGPADPVRRGRPLRFPRDHGAHPGSAIEWWYATGWAGPAPQPRWGWQITFFRARTGWPAEGGGRFAAPQLLFAHAAVTDLAQGVHRHAQRIVRWNGQPQAATGAAATQDARVHIGRWRLQREDTAAGPAWQARIDGEFELALQLRRTQPLLLQGDAGFSRKGPEEAQASHYYSEPHLETTMQLTLEGQRHQAAGRGWLDQEWSDSLMHPQAVGWDWIGINLDDGGALTAFQLRRADGTTLWTGGSHRAAGQAHVRVFADGELRFTPEQHWTSPTTGARYPVQWQLDTPLGRLRIESLLDAQELDGRQSTGTLYWEGLTRLLDARGQRIGLGYLELTGYGQPLRLG